ncbi:retron Ec78 anti-phage system effector HNH endonuclease PtuB [Candidatus Thiothrix sp. Deng01]|uniref:Retron Ec78 anti-phage system effector HNH endonuclease PtuB n=1 Tax=Candidatus Thiothrix phosphatis TaxID=3112415 RepID=A0ABU6CZ87_9GAMM|nr:retron Ec78 anti-phage system effector HNH endonuclease PtuB [Candidatus Thiothrix sp. Deng01]MEB4591698.1 retron Ec78 anti-phage system effector HNH endonuclease PtuB [Candidatus Thiothrix sp. Deng01]
MHKLTRPREAPNCLSRYRHGLNQWNEVAPAEKTQIWEKLDQMQQGRCAYCENGLSMSGEHYAAHIEHFRQRGRYPQGTFEWANLFGSCNRKDSCGKHKDESDAYPHEDLIKPDLEDPEHFFLFVSDGSIAIRQGLSAAEQHRAAATLRIFNLDVQHGALRQMRSSAVQGYIQTAEELAAMSADFPEDEWLELLQQELAAVEHLPFVTAIKHILKSEP